jgi:hypothetical protein
MKALDDVLSELTLRAISDDYEDFATIIRDVTEWVTERGLIATREQILSALEKLTSDGYAQAFFLSAGPPGKAERVPYSPQSLDKLCFYVTPKGKNLARKFQGTWS